MGWRERQGGVLTASGPEKDRQPRGWEGQEEKQLLDMAPGMLSHLSRPLLQTHVHISASRRARAFGGC